MLFSYNWLQSLIKKKLPKPKKLVELLTIHSFEVEDVKKKGNDFVLDINVLPNRASDCFSFIGIARECAALLGIQYNEPSVKLVEDKKVKAKNFVSIQVKNKNDCPRYSAGVMIDIKVGPSPKWMQQRLNVCGLRPISNIVDIANYVMLETGQPLHAFDLDKIAEQKIIVRKAKKGEKILTLDDEKYDLDKDILLIADKKGPLAIAGIKGGKRAEIDKKTKRIVLESANFNPKTIRSSSKKIKLKTDASWRFEHGIDPNLTEIAINRALELIQEIAGGQIAQGLVDYYPKKVSAKTIKLDLADVEGMLGVKISDKAIKNILNKLGFEIFEVKAGKVKVKIPTRRLDISIPEDLIEEIGRIFGLEKIPCLMPQVSLTSPTRNLDIFWLNFIKNILKEVGFFEGYNRSFISQKDADIFKYKSLKLIELKNPPSADYQYLRPNLIINLLKNVKENQKFSKGIKIFELGKVFKKKKSYKEKRMLVGLLEGGDFYEVKGMIDLLFNKLGISNVWYDDYQVSPEDSKISIWNSKICAEIKVDNQEIGFLGEISKNLLENLKIKNKLVGFELDFEKLKEIASQESAYSPVSVYPAAIRDLAVLVPKETKIIEVFNIINISGGKLIKDIDVFDIYEGEEISENKKNFAFHLIYQAEDRTLKANEINKIHKKIIKTLEKNPEWQVRK